MNLNKQLDKLIFKKQHKRLLDESLLDVRQKNASNLSDEEFKKLMSFDPIISQIPSLDDATMANTNESFSRWLLKMFKNGSLQNAEPEQVRKLLQDFEIAKRRRNLLPNNDINSYKNLDDLQNALNNISQNLTINQKNKDARRSQAEIKKELTPGMYLNGGAELLYINDNWEVWTPHTYEGSKALRHGACWCTGGDTPNFYNSYTKDGKLYIIINKNNKDKKYQLFVPFDGDTSIRSREFRDKNNESVLFREFIHNNDLVDFFLTQDDVTATYEDLDNPDIDDEWNEDREYEIMNEYNLSYDDWGRLCIAVDYSDLVNRTYWTDWRDYKEMASTGYNDGGYSDIDGFKKEVMKSEYFFDDGTWKDTDLFTLYKYYLKDSNKDEKDIPFNEFLYVLFDGAANGMEMGDHDSNLYEWFTNKGGSWEKRVCDTVTSTYLATDPIDNFIYESLQRVGWNPPRNYNSYRDRSYENYLENFKNYFIIELDDYHSVEDFWLNAVDRGNISPSEFLSDYQVQINEDKDDINPDDANFSEYFSEFAEEDATNICKIFVENLNDVLNINDENEEENNDSEDSIKSTESDNYIVFHDSGSLFYISKKDMNRMIQHYKENNDFNSWGFPSEIIREQIAKYPTDYIKKLLLKYGNLNEYGKEQIEKMNDYERFNLEYLTDQFYTFIDNTLKNYVIKECDEPISESLFEPDW